MNEIQLYNASGWEQSLPALSTFNIVPEIRAFGTISKGYMDKSKGYPVKLDHFIVHHQPECTQATRTDAHLLKAYGVQEKDLKQLHVSILSPSTAFKVGRFKFGKSSGVICASDDNQNGKPLMDMVIGKEKVLELGVLTECESCLYAKDGTCSETLIAFFSINAKDDYSDAPYLPTQLFKLSIPRTARNLFFGDLAISMQGAYHLLSSCRVTQSDFPQSRIPFILSLCQRTGQYFDEKKRTQVKTSYFVPTLALDYQRMIKRLESIGAKSATKLLPVETIIEQDHEPEIVDIPEIDKQAYDPKISESQKKRLEVLIKEFCLDRERVKAYCQKAYNVDHFQDLTPENYNDLNSKIPLFVEKIKAEKAEKANVETETADPVVDVPDWMK